MTPNTMIIDTTPRALADGLDTLVQALDHDREVANVLAKARDQLRAIGWNRWAARTSKASARQTFIARHKSLREGLSHA